MNDIVSIPRLDPIYSGFVNDIKKVVDEVVQEKNFERGFQIIKNLVVQGKALDDSVGMFLNGMNDVWVPSEHEGEKFKDAALRETGLKPITVYRHLKIQRALPQIPEQFKDDILEKGQKEKIQIAELVDAGYEVTEEDWLKLAEAVDEKHVGQIAREIKGVEPRSNWLAITEDDDGRLFVHTARGHKDMNVRLPVESDDEDIQWAIRRIRNNAHIEPSSRY